jgi:low affinity Fe/Cu permease
MSPRSRFATFARRAARAAGRPTAFIVAALCVALWGLSGPVFGFSDTWQLVINTATTVVTFLMVFLIQNTQDRDSEAVQVKLDELIRATRGAHNALLDLEQLDAEELDEVRRRYERLADRARAALKRGRGDTDAPDVAERAIRTERAVRATRRRRLGNGRSGG